jgi:hypothetical protein
MLAFGHHSHVSLRKDVDDFLNLLLGVFMYSSCYLRFFFSIIGHSVTIWGEEINWNLLNTCFVPCVDVHLSFPIFLWQVGMDVSQIIGKESGVKRWLTCQLPSQDRDRNSISIQSYASLRWGLCILCPVYVCSKKAGTRDGLAYLPIILIWSSWFSFKVTCF